MIKKIILVGSFFLICKFGMASPQMPDYLIYNGDTLPVYHLILEQYLTNKGETDGGSLFGLSFRDGASFNCWRGYQAIYGITNDSLFLYEIIHCGEIYHGNQINQVDSKKKMNEIFGESVINDRVFIDWFSGGLSLPIGNLLRWDGVFHKTFESEQLISIEYGKIKNVEVVSNYIDFPDRINRKFNDTISNVLFNELKKIEWKSIDKFDCSEEYLVTIDENGEVSEVSMIGYQTKEEIEEFWERNEYNYCIRTIRKGLRDLKFDILKRGGIPVEEGVYLEIWLEDDGELENWTN